MKMDFSQKSKWFALLPLTLLYTCIVTVDLFAEYFSNTQVVYVLKPLISAMVILIYYFNSQKKNIFFMIALALALVSSILFIGNETEVLLLAVSVFAVHRICLIILLLKILQIRDFIPVAIACLPVLLIFFYLLSINSNLPLVSVILFSLNNIIIAFFCGIVIANYMMKKENNNAWLLISALMFIALQMIVYIEKFYLIEFSPKILRPTAVFFFSLALITLVRGVLTQERLNRNAST